jgi:hypothetical protein
MHRVPVNAEMVHNGMCIQRREAHRRPDARRNAVTLLEPERVYGADIPMLCVANDVRSKLELLYDAYETKAGRRSTPAGAT